MEPSKTGSSRIVGFMGEMITALFGGKCNREFSLTAPSTGIAEDLFAFRRRTDNFSHVWKTGLGSF
jgi:hypothetical protein